MYAIVDIETTGGSPVYEKITEIAIFIHDGNRIIDEFVSLVNPERYIPAYITALTGITNEMVADAPKFYEIARKILELTENKTFVAHNVSFDYGFIKNEFKSLGYHFQRERLCTVRLSRKLIPGQRSYSLGNLCDELGIKNYGRHRAAGDAAATVRLLEILLELDKQSGLSLFSDLNFRLKNLNPYLSPETLMQLPEEPGVYYFLDEKQNVIYIGKSKNIKSRVLAHLSNKTTKKAINLTQRIAEINYELTGSELIALLKESYEIKKFKPLYNRAQRRSLYLYGLYSFTDNDGYINFILNKNDKQNDVPLLSFNSKKEAVNYLNARLEEFQLCQKLCGLYYSDGACFHYELMECRGACLGKEPAPEYNSRAQKFLETLTLGNKNIIIVDHGRTVDEYSVVKIMNGKYIGFGYVDAAESVSDPDEVDDYIERFPDNRDIQSIIRSYLKKQRVIKVLQYQ